MNTDKRSEDQARAQLDSIKEMLAALTAAEDSDNMEARDAAQTSIQEDPLSVEVRSGWTTPGAPMEAAEFCILLCTGGPAVRILGELDEHMEPSRAWIEHQDWGTPWTHYITTGSDTEAVLAYARQFYFGA